MKKVFVSRHGLVQCPSCTVHFRPDGDAWNRDWLQTASCPMCHTELAAHRAGGTLERLRNAGRSGALAAALFGMAAAAPLAGCEKKADTVEPEKEQRDDVVMENPYGVPPEPIDLPVTHPDAVDQTNRLEPAAAPEPPSGEEYGLPPEMRDPPETLEKPAPLEELEDGVAPKPPTESTSE